MSEPVQQSAKGPHRYPLSNTQEWFCGGDRGDEAGTFGPQFTSEIAVRIAGQVDLAALRGALDDLVRRHEILRTIVVRDAEPRYQQVYPPTPARLEVVDLPPVDVPDRESRVQAIVSKAARRGIAVRDLPLLRAELHRFDERDSVLVVCSHHTAADGWSTQVIIRDLAAFYRARTTGRPIELPAPVQYREFVAWEHARHTGRAAENTRAYWRAKLHGARIITLPTDRELSSGYTRPYSAHYFSIHPEVAAATIRLSAELHSSAFMVLLAAFYVLGQEINGTLDQTVSSFSSGRSDPSTHDLVGSIVNALPLRTDIEDCVSFRDVLTATRRTCLDAYTHEIPAGHIDAEAPQLHDSQKLPGRCGFFAFSMFQPHVDDRELTFADGSYQVRREVDPDEEEAADLGGGCVWDMDMLSPDELTGTIRFNLDEFDERTIAGWVAAYQRILAAGTACPERAWKSL